MVAVLGPVRRIGMTIALSLDAKGVSRAGLCVAPREDVSDWDRTVFVAVPTRSVVMATPTVRSRPLVVCGGGEIGDGIDATSNDERRPRVELLLDAAEIERLVKLPRPEPVRDQYRSGGREPNWSARAVVPVQSSAGTRVSGSSGRSRSRPSTTAVTDAIVMSASLAETATVLSPRESSTSTVTTASVPPVIASTW